MIGFTKWKLNFDYIHISFTLLLFSYVINILMYESVKNETDIFA